MSKGCRLRPANEAKYEEGYKRAFGRCANHSCPSRWHCTRWLTTPSMFEKNIFEFKPDETGRCNYYSEFKNQENFGVKND